MGQINCQIDEQRVLIVEYEIKDGQLLCADDIVINGWKIDKRIAIYGGTWKYDTNAYYEFVITDPVGITKVFALYINNGKKMDKIGIRAYCSNVDWVVSIRGFLEKSTLWKYHSWNEFQVNQTK